LTFRGSHNEHGLERRNMLVQVRQNDDSLFK
jgi:hypothetical protein